MRSTISLSYQRLEILYPKVIAIQKMVLDYLVARYKRFMFLYPKTNTSVEARELRFLVLSIVLGVIFSALFGFALILLNKQGRI